MVCLLVVCVIATIIILYQRVKHRSPQQQPSTDLNYEPPPYMYNTDSLNTRQAIQCTGLYSHTSHHGGHLYEHPNLLSPPLYSTIADIGASDDYAEITEACDGGSIYCNSAVVFKNGKKTTVKTMQAKPQDEQTSNTVQPVDVIDGMVYSAVIIR